MAPAAPQRQLGPLLAQLRQARGYSQPELARLTQDGEGFEVSQSAISMTESSSRGMADDVLTRLLLLLKPTKREAEAIWSAQEHDQRQFGKRRAATQAADLWVEVNDLRARVEALEGEVFAPRRRGKR